MKAIKLPINYTEKYIIPFKDLKWLQKGIVFKYFNENNVIRAKFAAAMWCVSLKMASIFQSEANKQQEINRS